MFGISERDYNNLLTLGMNVNYLIFPTYLIHDHYIILYVKFCLLNIVAEHYCVTARIFFFYNFTQGTLNGIAINLCLC